MPFLKWAGGKRWLAHRLAHLLHDFRGTYYEPFLGSAAVYLHYQPRSAVLSDANEDLISCYLAIRANPTGVQSALQALADLHPDQHYYDVRDSKPSTEIEKAARFIYLNRTCWNGLYRVNLKGEFNVPRGTKTRIVLAEDDFHAVSRALLNVRIFTQDFELSIDQAQEGDLVFADPPYTVAHNTNGFVKYNQKIFTWGDQVRLAAALKRATSRGAHVISTNADHPAVVELYSNDFDLEPVSRASVIAASSANRKSTTELFITNAPRG